MKMSIYASENGVQRLMKVVEPVEDTEKEFNRSARLNGVAYRYLLMMDLTIRELPFSDNEWGAILNCNNGSSYIHPESWSYSNLWASVADTPSLKEQWGIDQGVLLDKMRSLDLLGFAAVQEVIDRFWTQDVDGTVTECLDAALGRKPAEVAE